MCSSKCTAFSETIGGESICVSSCSVANPFLNKTTCQQNCASPKLQLTNITGKYCLDSCPESYFADTGLVCRETCANSAVRNSSGLFCVAACTGIEVLDKTQSTPTCASACPAYAYKSGSNCLLRCETNKYHNVADNTCINSCVSTLGLINATGKFCLSTCPRSGYLRTATECIAQCPANEYPSFDSTNNYYVCLGTCTAPQILDLVSTFASCVAATACTPPYIAASTSCVRSCTTASDYVVVTAGSQNTCSSSCSNFKYVDALSVKYCLSACPTSASLLKTSTTPKECRSSCDPTTEYLVINSTGRFCDNTCTDKIDNTTGLAKCLSSCPNGTYENNFGGVNSCVLVCPNPNNFHIVSNSLPSTCASSCTSGYLHTVNSVKYCL
jgi:hypothetical protein